MRCDWKFDEGIWSLIVFAFSDSELFTDLLKCNSMNPGCMQHDITKKLFYLETILLEAIFDNKLDKISSKHVTDLFLELLYKC